MIGRVKLNNESNTRKNHLYRISLRSWLNIFEYAYRKKCNPLISDEDFDKLEKDYDYLCKHPNEPPAPDMWTREQVKERVDRFWRKDFPDNEGEEVFKKF